MLNRRTRIVHRDFICKSDAHHRFRAAVKADITDDGTTVERSASFLIGSIWLPLPMCLFEFGGKTCGAIAEEASTYDPDAAQVPESERTVGWLSADGTKVAIPGKRDATMPERYAVAGYRKVEAHSMRDIDRMQVVRERQTGNTVDNEMNYDRETRDWHDTAPYDAEDMTNRI